MNSIVQSMLQKYQCKSAAEYENALKEIIQEVALLGLWRAKFFEHAAFYGGTSLRILYKLDRFSEDLDFSLLKTQSKFNFQPYLNSVGTELKSLGFEVQVQKKEKSIATAIDSAFVKANTVVHLLKIDAPEEIVAPINRASSVTVKIEVDTDPPQGFQTEAKTLLLPIPFAVNTYKLPDLFAGKTHAVLQRKWKTRVKGRDYYDFIWYIARDIPVRLKHLELRLRQSGGWTKNAVLTKTHLKSLLEEKFSQLNIEAAKKDVHPFIRDSSATNLWSKDLFVSLLSKLETI